MTYLKHEKRINITILILTITFGIVIAIWQALVGITWMDSPCSFITTRNYDPTQKAN